METLQAYRYHDKSLQDVLLTLIGKDAGFPNLSKLAEILEVIPVTTATVERSFSSRLGEETLEHTMRICIEGPQQLSEQNTLLMNIEKLKDEKLYYKLDNKTSIIFLHKV